MKPTYQLVLDLAPQQLFVFVIMY